jgi:(2Fe-2S) ferredoxin
MRCKELQLTGQGGVRVNSAGCLDRCDLGPVLVVYPQDVWYSYVDEEDIEEILQKHIVGGEIVERLRLK